MRNSRERLSRVLGYRPITISRGGKRAVWSALISIPMGLTATTISDSTVVPDGFRYVFAPGTMLAFRLLKPENSHRGVGALGDAIAAYTSMMSWAFFLNAIFYGLLIFCTITAISASKSVTR